MEKPKSSLNTQKMCRFCLSRDESQLTSLYEKSKPPKNTAALSIQIMGCVGVDVFPSDGQIQLICERCKFFMDMFYRYKQIVRSADECTYQFTEYGEPLNPVLWNAKLTKAFKRCKEKLKKAEKVKTMISETGAKVQVTASNVETDSDEDEDEESENVYNIKIGDNNEEKQALIKVVKSGDKLHITKDEKVKDISYATGLNLTRHLTKHVHNRMHSCKYCDRSFVKAQHLTRHINTKHKDCSEMDATHGSDGESYRCDQCDDTFTSQDDLIYHSAKHATENLICPLCQEKFNHVEEVSTHIKTHVEGSEFMCDLCELVFTSKHKLDKHLVDKHEEELRHEQELVPADESMEEDEDESIHLKEENGEMVVEIKKPSEFMKKNTEESMADTTNSEDSEMENTYTELSTVEVVPKPATPPVTPVQAPKKPVEKETPVEHKKASEIIIQTSDFKKKPVQNTTASPKIATPPVKKAETVPVTTAGTTDKSLRLLEKELQELKRTNSRNEPKASPKVTENVRRGRPQLHTSTPKPKTGEEKKTQNSVKTFEKKQTERRPQTKENKEPNDKSNASQQEETPTKEVVAKAINNGSSDRTSTDEPRRSGRTPKVKDYAKMLRDRSKVSSDESSEDDDQEYLQNNEIKKTEGRGRPKKEMKKLTPAPALAAAGTPAVKKRGRPRKYASEEPSPKLAKITAVPSEEKPVNDAPPSSEQTKTPAVADKTLPSKNETVTTPTKNTESPKPIIMSPSGQTLKAVPLKSLPPGVKPLPLPANARPVSSGEVCEMQLGKKMVKVQKIVMTKAEVEAMAKKGLVEMKDGAIVLKQGIKVPTADLGAVKTSAVNTSLQKESPSKVEKGAPTRYDLESDDLK